MQEYTQHPQNAYRTNEDSKLWGRSQSSQRPSNVQTDEEIKKRYQVSQPDPEYQQQYLAGKRMNTSGEGALQQQ